MAIQKDAHHQASATEAFLMNCWYVAAWDHELIDGKLLARTILDKPVVLYKGDSPASRWRWMTAAATAARCSPRAASRATACAACTTASSSTRPASACRSPGRTTFRPSSACAATRWSSATTWSGSGWAIRRRRTRRRSSTFRTCATPAGAGIPGYLHYDANYLLIVDNLADFAHLAFVHAKTLGGSEEYAFKSKPTAIERLDDGFRVERWHMGAPPPPFHKKVVRDAGAGGPAQHRAHVRAGHLLHGDPVLAGGLGRGEGQPRGREAVPQLPVLHAGDLAQHALLLGLPARLRAATIRTSRCRSTTAWSRASTRTRRSSRRSRRRWKPIPRSR